MAFPEGRNPNTEFKPGVSGNPKGRPVGAKSWSTVIRELVEDPEFEIKFANGVTQKYPAKVLTEVMIRKAASGDVQAFNALAKYIIGDKLDVTSGGEKLETPAVYLPRRDDGVETVPEAGEGPSPTD